MFKVMLADDEPIMRKALNSLVNWEQYDCEVVYCARNGLEVSEKLDEVKPDILISDIRMPGKDGIELAREIYEEKRDIAVIILTAYSDFEYAKKALQYGVVDYVTKTDVLDQLGHSLEMAAEKLKGSRNSEGADNKQLRLENMLKSVFNHSVYDKSIIEDSFSALSVELRNYAVLIIQIQISDELTKKRSETKIRESIDNFFNMAFENYLFQAIPVERDRFAVILAGCEPLRQGSLIIRIKDATETMNRFMHLKAGTGVSSFHVNCGELGEAYKEAELALESEFLSDRKNVYFYGDGIKEKEHYDTAENDRLVSEITENIRLGNDKTADECFDELLSYQREQGYGAHTIKNTELSILMQCSRITDVYDKSFSEVTGIRENFTEIIREQRFIEEYEALMRKVIGDMCGFMAESRDRSRSIIKECEEYIDKHYMENLVLDEMADSIGTSTGYLSRRFKELTGQTIIEYTNKKRLEKAKEYLSKDDVMIYEVAEKLGFGNATYFSHFFRKATGMTPKEYKDSCQ
ncbi:MAG: response regulator [Lachnospiraceae bacterium]